VNTNRITSSEALEKIAASKREYEQWKQKTFEERATRML
jgi:succinate-semialdehyde dehydrogenase/glutarate-semialdehyde dehydrogenase